jgi:hypothetical protein
MRLNKVASIAVLSVTWHMVSDSVLHRRKMTQRLQKEINLSVDLKPDITGTEDTK